MSEEVYFIFILPISIICCGVLNIGVFIELFENYLLNFSKWNLVILYIIENNLLL